MLRTSTDFRRPTALPVRRVTRRGSALLAAALVSLGAACNRTPAAQPDDALRNDLALATQAQQQRSQFVSPQELGQQPYAQPGQVPYGQAPYGQPGYAPYGAQPQQAAAAPAPVRERVVYRDRPVSRSRSSSSGSSRSSSGGSYSAAAAQAAAERERAEDVRRTRARRRQQGAITGAVAGGAIGAVTGGRDRVKSGVIGAAAGGLLGAVIGNNQKNNP